MFPTGETARAKARRRDVDRRAEDHPVSEAFLLLPLSACLWV